MSETMLGDHLSFSQLSSACECPYGFFLQKLIGVESVPNAFAQGGSLAHEIIAGWANGSIPIDELAVQWIQRFPKEVSAEFPSFLASKGFKEKFFDGVLTYFEHFDGFPGYEIIGAEQEFTSSLAGEKFVGVIDLILRDEKTGSLMLVDHKSTSLSSFKRNKEKMYRQLLIYSKYCADTFGSFPQTLCFNLFREGILDQRPFDSESYISARLWAEDMIETMRNYDITDWLETRPELFRCTQLCNCRRDCPFGIAENHKRKEKIYGEKHTPAVA